MKTAAGFLKNNWLVLAVVVVGFLLLRNFSLMPSLSKLFPDIAKLFPPEKDAVDNRSKQIDEVKTKEVEAAITPAIRTYAEQLFKAMSRIGTDEKTIELIFDKIKTVNEMKAVFVAYGNREKWGDLTMFVPFKTKYYNLVEALLDELDTDGRLWKKIEPKIHNAGLY